MRSCSSCLDKASKTVLAATILGEAARCLVGCLRAKSPWVAGKLAASSRPRPPYSGLSLVARSDIRLGTIEWVGAVAVSVSASGPIDSWHLPGEVLRGAVETSQEGILREVVLPYQGRLHLCPRGLGEVVASLG